MNTSILIRVDKDKKERFERMARRRGKTTSEVVREMMDEYVERHDMRGYLSKLISDIGEDFKKQGITQADIDRTIKEVRAEKRSKRS